MIDVKEIRANPDRLREAIRLRNVPLDKANVDRWLGLDDARRELRGRIDGLNAEKKKLSSLGRENPEAARARGQELREESRALEEEMGKLSKEWQAILDWFPNWPHPEMPEGRDEADNPEECVWMPGRGYLPPDKLGLGEGSAGLMPQKPVHADDPDFEPLHHVEIGQLLGAIDVVQGAKVAGSRFTYILRDVAVMQMALQHLLTDRLRAMGYFPIIPPLLVWERSLYGTSHFPEGRDQVYAIQAENVEEGNQLFLVGSSEPSNFSYFMDRTLAEADLPLKIFATTSCFRSEAGSWGKDVKGIKRVHQFDKTEINCVCAPEQSEAVYKEFREINEWLLQTLELPYRIVEKCGGDAGYLATHRQRDVEVWLSGQREFMEVMTNTNTTDYQARRLRIRYKAGDGATRFCHTVNDTACAMGRMLIAILDNYQQKDRTVKVPTALQAFVGKDRLTPPE